MTVLLVWIGLFFVGVSVLGLIRAPDTTVRVHAITPAASLGVLCVALGVAWYFRFEQWVALKMLLLWLFVFFSNPLTAHLIFRLIRQWQVPMPHTQVEVDWFNETFKKSTDS